MIASLSDEAVTEYTDITGVCNVNLYTPTAFASYVDGWSLINTYQTFGYEKDYHMSIRRFFETYGINGASAFYSCTTKVPFFDRWNGNCFGMSLLSLAQFYGIVDLKPYFQSGSSSKNLYDFGYDYITTNTNGNQLFCIDKNKAAKTMIENALVSQFSVEIADIRVFEDDPYYTKLIEFLSSDKAHPLLLTVNGKNLTHTVVIEANGKPKKVTDRPGEWYSIQICDCNEPAYTPKLSPPAQAYLDGDAFLLVNIKTGEWEYYKSKGTVFADYGTSSNKNSLKIHDVSLLDSSFFTKPLNLLNRHMQLQFFTNDSYFKVTTPNDKTLLEINRGVIKEIDENCTLTITSEAEKGEKISGAFCTDEEKIIVESDGTDVLAFTNQYSVVSHINSSHRFSIDGTEGVASSKNTDSGAGRDIFFAIQDSDNGRFIAITDDYGNNVSVDIDGNRGSDKVIITSDNANFDYQKENVDEDGVIIKLRERIIGDTDGDGMVTISDATTVQKHLAQIIELNGDYLKAADTNGDGAVNIEDVTQIQKYLAQLIDHLG